MALPTSSVLKTQAIAHWSFVIRRHLGAQTSCLSLRASSMKWTRQFLSLCGVGRLRIIAITRAITPSSQAGNTKLGYMIFSFYNEVFLLLSSQSSCLLIFLAMASEWKVHLLEELSSVSTRSKPRRGSIYEICD